MIVVNPNRPMFQFTDIELEILLSSVANYRGPYAEGATLNEYEQKRVVNMNYLASELHNRLFEVLQDIHFGKARP